MTWTIPLLAMSAEGGVFTSEVATALFIVACGAVMMPLFSQYVRLPSAVGEILFGILVGPQVLSLVQPNDVLDLISQVGFFLLMFIAGLELNFTQILQGGTKMVVKGVVFSFLVFGLGLGFTQLISWHWYMACILGAISVGLPIAILHEVGLSRTHFGQRVLLNGSVGEFLLIVGMTGLSAFSHAGGINQEFLSQVMKLFGVFVVAYICLTLFRSLVWWYSDKFARVLSNQDPSEIGMRAGMALMFLFVALTAALHIDPILGSFLAGALFSFTFRYKEVLEHKFFSLGNGFFIPFFFINVGIHFDLEAAKNSNWGDFAIMLVVLFLLRFIASSLVKDQETPWIEVAGEACLLSAPLTLLVVLADFGVQLGYLTLAEQPTIIALAVVASSLYPLAFKSLLVSYEQKLGEGA